MQVHITRCGCKLREIYRDCVAVGQGSGVMRVMVIAVVFDVME